MPETGASPLLPPSRAAELRTIGSHAGVVLVGQLAVMAFGVTDTVVAGRYSETALAALAVGTAVYISVYVGLMGILQALLPVWAELHGSRRNAAVGPSVRQSLYLCAATIVVGMVALLSPGPLLNAAGVPAELQVEVRRYLAVLAWALPPALLFRLYSTLNQSLGKPRLVSALQIGSLGLKIPLSVWFTFGGAGLPAQGAAGCAWATLVVNYALLGFALWLLLTQGFYRPYALWRRMERPDWPQLGAFLRLGIPAGLAVLVEVSSFTFMALFISRMGTTAAAGHQIAFHSASHEYSDIYQSADAYWKDIDLLKERLSPYVRADGLRYLRFPGGSTNTVSRRYGGRGLMQQLKEEVTAKGYAYVDWNVCAEDAVGGKPSAGTIFRNIVRETGEQTQCIVLMHDSATTRTTAEALPDIIQWYKDNGFAFLTVVQAVPLPTA